MWLQKTEENLNLEETTSDFSKIEVTDAYTVKITEAYTAPSKDPQSKSLSLWVSVENEDGETGRTRFTLTGRDGNTFYINKKGEKAAHIGLKIANSLFQIALGKEIFDVEPSEVDIKVWDNDSKEMVDAKADGFPELIGKTVGIQYQMHRTISGTDSKEYGEITRFFDNETGLGFGEVESNRTKLDAFLRNKKEFIVTEETAPQRSSSFGKKAEPTEDGAPVQKRWGK